jgi:hypothetical protein
MFFFVWFFVPETKGISLERMDELFGVTEAALKNVDRPEDAASAAADDKATTTQVEVPVSSKRDGV